MVSLVYLTPPPGMLPGLEYQGRPPVPVGVGIDPRVAPTGKEQAPCARGGGNLFPAIPSGYLAARWIFVWGPSPYQCVSSTPENPRPSHFLSGV